jgi:hypothetical protein
VSQVRVHNFSVSLDGFGTGAGQSLEAPFGQPAKAVQHLGPVELTGRVRPCPGLGPHRARCSLVIAPRAAQLRAPEGLRTRRPEPPIGVLMHDLSSGIPTEVPRSPWPY